MAAASQLDNATSRDPAAIRSGVLFDNMAFTNSVSSTPRKSITELMRDAIAQSLAEEDAVLYVWRKISTKRISKRRLRGIYQDLSNDELSDRASKT